MKIKMLLFYINPRRFLISAVLFLLFAMSLPAQTFSPSGTGSGGGSATLRGSLHGALLTSNLLLELDPVNGTGLPSRTNVESQGSFVFRNLRPGPYQLKVVDMYGKVLHTQFVDVQRANGFTRVELPKRKAHRPVSGTISMARLQHKVPKEATKEFQRAYKAMKKNDVEKSLKHLAKAVEIDPEYFEAQINFGARLMQTGSPEAALAAFEKAIAIDPHMSVAYTNSAAALLMMSRPADAEPVARKAVDLDPLSARAQYVLGVSLLDQGKNSDEAIMALERASENIGAARLVLAQCYARQGKITQAKGAIEDYLAVASPEHRDLAKKMLAQLSAVVESN